MLKSAHVAAITVVASICFCKSVCASDQYAYGAKLYEKNCETCHHVGQNIISPEKTMTRSDKLKSATEFKKFLSRQNGLMPPYLTIVRKDKDLRALYEYIKHLNSAQQPEAVPTAK